MRTDGLFSSDALQVLKLGLDAFALALDPAQDGPLLHGQTELWHVHPIGHGSLPPAVTPLPPGERRMGWGSPSTGAIPPSPYPPPSGERETKEMIEE